MAKQAGPFFFTGTIGDVIFYKSGEQYLIRMKGSYNTKALQKPGARPLMQLRQQEFKQASQLASQARRQLPIARRKQVTIGSLTREARTLLRKGKTSEEIVATLLLWCKGETLTPKQEVNTSDVADASVEKKKLVEVSSQEQDRIAVKPLPILKQSSVKKSVSIAYIPQHRKSVSLPGICKQIGCVRKNRKLKWLAKKTIKLE